jgi:hypothetical protein
MPDKMPPVQSYVRTTLRDGATLHMAVIDPKRGTASPLMASWRFGNGQVLALATDGAGLGTAQWMSLPNYPLLWAQAIRQFLPEAQGPGLNVDLQRNGDSVGVIADVIDDAGAPVEGLSPSASFVEPDGEAGLPPLSLTELKSGRYEGTFTAVPPGTHTIKVTAGDQVADAAVDIAYPARFDFSRAARDKLIAVAAATGGTIMAADAPLPTAGTVWVAEPRWRPWLVGALALLMIDLAVRHVPTLFRLRRRGAMPAGAVAVPAE